LIDDHLPQAFQDFLERLNQAQDLNVDNLSCWMQALKWDPAWLESRLPNPLPTDDYHRNILASTTSYELAIITWPEGQGSEIHDHGISGTCGAVMVMQGQLFNHLYTIQDGQPIKGDAFILERGAIIEIPCELVHQMGNASEKEIAISLHLYTPPILEHRCWSLEPQSQVMG
jgi:predicted metal-dependent enzyme (double-stranded beta helix superfamily)